LTVHGSTEFVICLCGGGDIRWHRPAAPVRHPLTIGESFSACNARNLFRAGARVTFFGAKKVTKETLRSNSNLPAAAWPGFFDKASLPCRKTADLLSAALRVSDDETAHPRAWVVGTKSE
jgi:hypothetical protein